MKSPFQKLRNLLNRCLGDHSGAAAVEFALIAMPLMTLLLASFDLGYQAYLRSVVQGALNDVARSASMEAPSFNCTDATVVGKVQCAVKSRSDIVAREATYNVTVRNFYDFSGVGRPEKLVTDHNNNGQYDLGDCFIDVNTNRTFDVDATEDDEFNLDAGRDGVGGADDVAFYEVIVRMPRLFPIHQVLPVSSTYEITGQTAVRNQPYARQAVPPTVCP